MRLGLARRYSGRYYSTRLDTGIHDHSAHEDLAMECATSRLTTIECHYIIKFSTPPVGICRCCSPTDWIASKQSDTSLLLIDHMPARVGDSAFPSYLLPHRIIGSIGHESQVIARRTIRIHDPMLSIMLARAAVACHDCEVTAKRGPTLIARPFIFLFDRSHYVSFPR